MFAHGFLRMPFVKWRRAHSSLIHIFSASHCLHQDHAACTPCPAVTAAAALLHCPACAKRACTCSHPPGSARPAIPPHASAPNLAVPAEQHACYPGASSGLGRPPPSPPSAAVAARNECGRPRPKRSRDAAEAAAPGACRPPPAARLPFPRHGLSRRRCRCVLVHGRTTSVLLPHGTPRCRSVAATLGGPPQRARGHVQVRAHKECPNLRAHVRHEGGGV
jgi:hypothetical protein